jgi:hypothetical protein
VPDLCASAAVFLMRHRRRPALGQRRLTRCQKINESKAELKEHMLTIDELAAIAFELKQSAHCGPMAPCLVRDTQNAFRQDEIQSRIESVTT